MFKQHFENMLIIIKSLIGFISLEMLLK